MKQDLDELLCKTYPKIFVNRHGNMQETCMCWGFSHGSGWYNIIDSLCSNIQNHVDWTIKQHESSVKYNNMVEQMQKGNFELFDKFMNFGSDDFKEQRREEILAQGLRNVKPPCPQVVAEQVKEKFGTLRFYYSGGDDAVAGMVRMAESMSSVMCESCGVPAETGNHNGWIGTLCTSCTKERKQQQDESLAKAKQMELNYDYTIEGEDDGHYD